MTRFLRLCRGLWPRKLAPTMWLGWLALGPAPCRGRGLIRRCGFWVLLLMGRVWLVVWAWVLLWPRILRRLRLRRRLWLTARFSMGLVITLRLRTRVRLLLLMWWLRPLMKRLSIWRRRRARLMPELWLAARGRLMSLLAILRLGVRWQGSGLAWLMTHWLTSL